MHIVNDPGIFYTQVSLTSCPFSALSLFFPNYGYNMNLHNILFNVLCVSGTQLQNLLLEAVTLLLPGRTTNCFSPRTPGKPAPCLLGEDFLAPVDQKPLVIENYTISNKRNVSMRQVTTLETRQELFFCDAMHPGTCRHCKNSRVSRTTHKTQFSLSI